MLDTRLTTLASLLTTAAMLATPSSGRAQVPRTDARATPAKSTPTRKGYVPANGVNYYYEIHGRGEPLLLLHGGLGSIDIFEPGLPQLAQERQVIAVDLQGHGRTALGDRPISLIDMADDMAVLVKQLGQETVDVLGYSMGGGVGL